MKFWEYFWMLIIIFSTVSFTYMSIKILYNGFSEMKFMLTSLETEHNNNNGEN